MIADFEFFRHGSSSTWAQHTLEGEDTIPVAMTARRLLPCVLPLILASAFHGQEKTLHLAIGDPARKDKEAPVVLDGVTDTRTGEVLTPAELPKRLAGTHLVLVGESHTGMDYHRCELRVLQELVRAGRP